MSSNEPALDDPSAVGGTMDPAIHPNAVGDESATGIAGPSTEIPTGQPLKTTLSTPEEPSDSPSAEEQAQVPRVQMGGVSAAVARLFECLLQEWTVTEKANGDEADARGEKRVFALIRQKTAKQKSQTSASAVRSSSNPSGDRYDYEKKYPEDSEGEGMDSNARVWRVYLDEAVHFDTDMVENIRDTVDITLVSAGLFSAVISTLVSQVSTALQPDFSEVTAALLIELIAVQRAMVAGTVTGDVPPSTLNLESPSSASVADRWVNGLWFVSLAFSLATALLSVLVKQWIQAYVAPTFGTPHFQSRIRHFRYMGMKKWHVPLIIGMLPILLHLALFLFFAGLIVLLFTLDHIIAGFVTTVGIVAYLAYIGSNLLPVWYPECPYKAPLSRYVYVAVRTFGPTFRGWFHVVRRLVKASTSRIPPYFGLLLDHCQRHLHQIHSALSIVSDLYLASAKDTHSNPHNKQEQAPNTLQLMEHAAVGAGGDNLDAQMLSWLCDMSANPSVGLVVAGAVGDLRIGFEFSALQTLRNSVLPHACIALTGCLSNRKFKRGMESKAFDYLQAHMQLGPERISRIQAESSTQLGSPDGSSIGTKTCDCWLSKPYLDNESVLSEEPRFSTIRFLERQDCGAVFVDSPTPAVTPVPDAHNLRQMLPPAASKRTWILLLQRALLASMKSPSSTFSLEHDQDILHSWLSRLMPHWDMEIPGHDRAFSMLQEGLLSAYLCLWTRPQNTTIEHHHMLRAAIVNGRWGRKIIIRETIDRYTRRPSVIQPSGRHQRQPMYDLRAYYQAHIALHILVHYTRADSQGPDTLLYLSDQISWPEDYKSVLGLLSRHVVNMDGGHLTLPNDHPILDQLNRLIPTPQYLHTLIQDNSSRRDELGKVMKSICMISGILVRTIAARQLMPVVRAHDMLGGFNIAMDIFPPGEKGSFIRYHVYTAVSGLILGFSSCSHPRDYLDFVCSHLNNFCAWILVDFVHCSGPLTSPGHTPLQLKDTQRITSADSLDQTAEFIAKHTTTYHEYELIWIKAIHALPTLLLDDNHKLYIEPFTEWILPELTMTWSSEDKQRRLTKNLSQNATAVHKTDPKLWQKAQSALKSLIPSFIKPSTTHSTVQEQIEMGIFTE